MKKLAWAILLTFVSIALFSQTKNTSEDYINLYYEIAVRKMYEYKIPASITLAQGILESGNGNSALARNANNHFGIKCHSEWTGQGYYMDDDAANECFRVYSNAEESFADHSKFLTTRSRYKFLFTDYETDDYKNWAKGLKKAGYATNPNYANLLITIIERHELDKYDRMEYIIPSNTVDEPPLVAVNTNQYVLPEGAYYTNETKGIFIYNRIETVKSKGRQIDKLAEIFGVPKKKLAKYNDLDYYQEFDAGDNVFLQPKRKKGTAKTHKVALGQSMWQISQIYGIKLKHLYKKNNMTEGLEPAPGTVLQMKSKSESAPKTISKEQLELNQQEAVKELIETPVVEPQIQVMETPKEVEAFEEKVITPVESANTMEVIEEVKVELEEEQKPNYIVVEEEIIPVVIDRQTPEYHIVGKEETLYSISNKYYVTVDELMEYNGLKNYSLTVGMPLRLLPKSPPSTLKIEVVVDEDKEVKIKEVTPELQPEVVKEVVKEVEEEIEPEIIKEDNRVRHVVQAKETLYALSLKYKVTVEQIKSWNNLSDNNLTIGQVLVVSPL